MSRPYQLVIYGATGFTGQLVSHFLALRHGGLRWAIAGRSEAKLRDLAARLKATHGRDVCGVLVGSGPTARDVTSQTDAIVTTAGPYALHGEPLLAAAIETKTDYADLTGESPWVSLMHAKYEAAAAAAGVTIIHMCGFDSIPSDVGMLALAQAARAKYPGCEINNVRAFMAGSGNISGGTIASGLNVASDPLLRRLAEDPYLLLPSGDPGARAAIVPVPDARAPFTVPEFGGKAAAPWVMAAINTRVVRRSAALLRAASAKLLAAEAKAPGKTAGLAALALPAASAFSSGSGAGDRGIVTYSRGPFAYSEYMLIPSLLVAYIMAIGMWVSSKLMAVGVIRRAVHRFLPQPGEGPSIAAMKRAWFHYNVMGEVTPPGATASRKVVARVSGGDGGYEDTAKMLAEAGVLLATRKADLPAAVLGGGFLTPATAFGSILPERLNAAGMRVEVVSWGDGTPGEVAALRGRGRPSPSWLEEIPADKLAGAFLPLPDGSPRV